MRVWVPRIGFEIVLFRGDLLLPRAARSRLVLLAVAFEFDHCHCGSRGRTIILRRRALFPDFDDLGLCLIEPLLNEARQLILAL